ncbi:MAG: M23 family metallopeptidase [Bacteroidales bacterium]|nr:M23 family metallopeptidase [Bacteroidales bacterium]
MGYRWVITALISIIVSTTLYGQGKAEFIPPLDIPLVLSGNFGELRSDHFHSGLDFKTRGVTGHPVYAVESGYVSRINISPGGYGKAVYIAHPNGYTTVYGHLQSFSEDIETYVKAAQYKRKKHSVNVFPEAQEIRVEKGEVIALSGNTGSSSGPHLHFEIRRTADQHPLNGLFFGFPIEDTIPPQIKQLAIYPADHLSMVQNARSPYRTKTVQEEKGYVPAKSNPYHVYGKIGFGIEVYDYLNAAGNRCGVYSIELLVDGKRHYYSEMDGFSFSESRFINAHIDYAGKIERAGVVQRMFRVPFNELSIYKQVENGGFLEITDSREHHIVVRVKDSHGNGSELSFRIRGAGAPQSIKERADPSGKILPYNAESSFVDQQIAISFPAWCFYDDVNFRYARTGGMDGLLSDIHHLHRETTPVHRSFDLAIAVNPDIPEAQRDKLFLARISNDEMIGYAGGVYADGAVSEKIRSFGSYAIAIDTVAPEIIPLNMYSGKDMTGLPAMRFKVKDNLSGVGVYNGTIDGAWVLFEYDPKNDLVFYEFDDRVPVSGKSHRIELQIEDMKGNKTVYQSTFFL